MSDGARKTGTKSSTSSLLHLPLPLQTSSIPSFFYWSLANLPPLAIHFLSGLTSGLLSAILLQPIDLLKTRVQQSGHHSLLLTIREIRSAAQASSLHPTLPLGLFPSIAALWRGTVPSALRTGFGSAVYFTCLNKIRENAGTIPLLASQTTTIEKGGGSSSLPKLNNTGNMLAGSVARGFAGFLLMPLTVIKVRYESSLYSYTSVPSAARSIFATEGLRGFFAGFGATAVRDAPYAGLYVLFYEQSKRTLGGSSLFSASTGGSEVVTERMGVSRAAAINFSSAMYAGVLCSVVTNPFDAVKTRIQLQPGQYKNMFSAARKMLAEEGLRSMWDGLGLRMSRKALSSALAWTVYEELVRRAEGTLRVVSGKKDRVL